MPRQEISRDDWNTFFEGFAKHHRGWLVTLEALGAQGMRAKARQLPLKNIIADLDTEEGDRLAIVLGGGPDKLVKHFISSPSRVEVQLTDEGVEKALLIESAKGITTQLQFRSVVLPEVMDGAVAD
jgi:hypothetical protein